MSYFSAEWIARASQLFGDAPSIRVSVRGPSAGSTVTIVTAVEEVLDLSPIVVEREREFAVTQGQAWQVSMTNLTMAPAVRAAAGGWARLEVGYPDEDVWATLAVGKLEDVRTSTDGTISLEVEDQLVTLVGATLKRPVRFSDIAWASDITSVKKAEDSADYDNVATGAGCEIVAGGADIADEDFRIVFTSATAFKIVLPSGDESQTGNITTDCTFVRDGGSGSIKINKEGWSAYGTYAADDEFILTTARPREDGELGAVGMIRHLIVDIAGIEVYDFDTDTMISPLYDNANWTALITETIGDTCFGTFAKGDSIMDMIQGILPLHVALYPRPNGQIAVWYMLPAAGGGRTLNGNHDGGDVHIVSGSVRDAMASVYNRIAYTYRTRGAALEATYEKINDASSFDYDRPLEIDTPWEINQLSIVTAVDRGIIRFGAVANPYDLQMPFAGATVDIGETVQVVDSALGAALESVGVVKVAIDPLRAVAQIEAIIETITLGDYFKIAANDESSGSQIGDVGDPGARRIY